MEFDVVVVGASVAGCRTAELIASKGYKVAVLEEHKNVGIPPKCAGLVSWRLKELLPSLPSDLIINVVDRAKFFSPSGNSFLLESKKPVYVIDRKKLDEHLFARAVESGCKSLLSTKFIEFDQEKCAVITTKGKIKTKMLIGADGANSTVARAVGLRQPSNILFGLQATVKGSFEKSCVELWFGRKIAPDFFAWVIPENENRARIGLATDKNHLYFFESFLKKRAGMSAKPDTTGLLRLGLMKETVDERVLLVGDAACHVKPFSIDSEECVLINIDGFIRNEKIGELEKYGVKKENDNFTSFDFKKPIYAFSLDKLANKPKFYKINKLLSHEIKEPLYEIILDRGFRIKTTCSHSIMTLGNGKIIPKKVSELKPNEDFLLCSLEVPNNETIKEINLIKLILQEAPELVPNVRVRGGKKLIYKKRSHIPSNLPRSYWYNDSIPLKYFLEKSVIPEDVILTYEPAKKSVKIPNKIKITPEFCRLLGYYVAEGHCKDEKELGITFGTQDKKLGYIDDFLNCLKAVFGIKTHKPKKLKNPETKKIASYQFSFGGYLLTKIFKRVFRIGTNTYNKRVPFIIFNIPNNLKKEFLKAYLRGDGAIRIRTPKDRRNWSAEISAKSVSEKLISDLVLLSLQLGLLPSVEDSIIKERMLLRYKLKQSRGYKISFSNKRDLLFLADVFPSKKSMLLRYLNQVKGRSTLNFPRKFIPKDLLHQFAREMCEEYTSYSTYKTFGYERLNKIFCKKHTDDTHFKLIENLIKNKILVAPIKEIRKVEPSTNNVFDLVVPETNTFIGGIGCLVLHNSGGGLIYGLTSSKICAAAAVKALSKNKFNYEFLKREYDEKWKKSLAYAIQKGMLYRRTLSKLSDWQLDMLFIGLKCGKKLLERLDMDFL